jgi:hypothetical protein
MLTRLWTAISVLWVLFVLSVVIGSIRGSEISLQTGMIMLAVAVAIPVFLARLVRWILYGRERKEPPVTYFFR